ncbi:family 20 glycosylhydrolase [Cohnella sp. GbtcB17]|uniref:family 20 glycosylhydrolase n=1 Tax=Cohnella sp. GbtcB17 TaxID=2824762 RepID=UPI001C2F148A|nr:family 20 glycosylhydrolase [Cohnella sp. GbtcB17]
MKLDLIPQPQYVRLLSEDGDDHRPPLPAPLAGMRVKLLMPQSDDRLLRLARELFGETQVAAETSPGTYALLSEGLPLRRAAVERLDGHHDGYVLHIGDGGLSLHAREATGLYYGLKTLLQLMRRYAPLPAVEIADWADLPLRSDYLDLRTVYPAFPNLLKYIAEMSDYKLNTLVVEYEDKLPFGRHAFLRHPELAMTEAEHALLLRTCRDHYIEVIPKQQSFGHLEFILKHPAYIALRETPDSVGELCPHRPGAYEMMAGILEDVAALHPDSRYLHMGCDEVWSLGECPDCRASGMTREASFIAFVNRLAARVRELGKRPMIWHDMLMHASHEELSALDPEVTVVVWIYGGHRMKRDALDMIGKLRRAGLSVIGASSVRCWDDEGDQNYPVIRNRVANIMRWTELAEIEQLPGVIGTNWSAPFALGSPYGLFETSRYPAFFSADQCWNRRADPETYLARFLSQYHGMDDAASAADGYEIGDYYQLVPELLPDIALNRPVAELIAAMIQYEMPAKRRLPLYTFLFRGELYPGEEVLTSLKDKHRTGYAALEAAQIAMRQAIEPLLPPAMAELFIASRFYRFGLYEEKLQAIVSAAEAASGERRRLDDPEEGARHA